MCLWKCMWKKLELTEKSHVQQNSLNLGVKGCILENIHCIYHIDLLGFFTFAQSQYYIGDLCGSFVIFCQDSEMTPPRGSGWNMGSRLNKVFMAYPRWKITCMCSISYPHSIQIENENSIQRVHPKSIHWKQTDICSVAMRHKFEVWLWRGCLEDKIVLSFGIMWTQL